MGNFKNIVVVALVVAVAVMGYMIMVSIPDKAEAECEAAVETQVISAVSQCQQTLQQLMQVPACAAVLSQ